MVTAGVHYVQTVKFHTHEYDDYEGHNPALTAATLYHTSGVGYSPSHILLPRSIATFNIYTYSGLQFTWNTGAKRKSKIT